MKDFFDSSFHSKSRISIEICWTRKCLSPFVLHLFYAFELGSTTLLDNACFNHGSKTFPMTNVPQRRAPQQGGLSESCSLCKEEWEANYLCNDSTVQISTPKLSSVGTSKTLLSLTRWYTQSIYCINKQTWKCVTSRWKVLVVQLFILVPTSKVSEPNTFGSTTKPTLQTKVIRIPYPYCPTCPTIHWQRIFSTHRCEL